MKLEELSVQLLKTVLSLHQLPNEVETLPEVQVEKEEVSKEEPTLSNVPTIKVELSGEVSLLEIHKRY